MSISCGSGSRLPRRPAFQDVDDEDVRPRQPDLAEQLVEQLPGLADERHALLVLVGPGRLADEHQVGVGVAGAEDHGLAGRGELRAARADRRLPVDGLELLAAFLRAGHGTRVAPPAARTERGFRTLRGIMEREAVTTMGRTSKTTVHPPTPSRYLMRELDRIASESTPEPAPSSAPAGSATPWPPRCAPPASRSRARSAAARSRRRRRGAAVRARRRDRAAAAAADPATAQLVGHCSGATGLDVLGDREGFSLHPLMTVPERRRAGVRRRRLRGGGHDRPRARRSRAGAGAARSACAAVEVADEDRAAYHAAASIAANFLVTLEGAAERLAATAGVDRASCSSRSSAPRVENWAATRAPSRR